MEFIRNFDRNERFNLNRCVTIECDDGSVHAIYQVCSFGWMLITLDSHNRWDDEVLPTIVSIADIEKLSYDIVITGIHFKRSFQ